VSNITRRISRSPRDLKVKNKKSKETKKGQVKE